MTKFSKGLPTRQRAITAYFSRMYSQQHQKQQQQHQQQQHQQQQLLIQPTTPFFTIPSYVISFSDIALHVMHEKVNIVG